MRHRHDHLLGLDFQTVGDLREALDRAARAPPSVTETLTIAARFNGPPGSANGGYTCGLVAGLVGAEAVEVTLRSPPPLGRPLAVVRDGERGRAARRRGAGGRGRGPPSCCSTCPSRCRADEIERGRARGAPSAGATDHPFPTCFVCGPRARQRRRPAHLPGRAAGPRRALRRALASRTRRSPATTAGCAPSVSGRRSTARRARRSPTSAAGPPMVLARLSARLGCPVPSSASSTRSSRGSSAADGRKREGGGALYDSRGAPPVRFARALDRAAATGYIAPMATHYRTCPFCEATCGLEIETEGRRGGGRPRRRRGRLQPRLHLPEGVRLKQLHEDPDRLRTPLVRRDGELVEASWDEAFAEIERRPAAASSPSTARTRSRSTSATRTPTTSRRSSTRRALAPGARHAERLLGVAPSTRCRSRSRPGCMFGTMLSIPVPDVDRSRPPADARRQPARLERQPADRARHARPAARDPRARRQGRGGRPAPHAHRRGGRRAPLHPARHRRAAARRDRVHARRGGPRAPRARSRST